jgi:phosphatidylglycerol:prolipoprotein diacylglycerol transferase
MESAKTVSYMRNYMMQQAISEGASTSELVGISGEGLVHPCFLYESLWCILGFVVLHLISKKRSFKGEIGLLYCVWYGFGRGFIELLRTDSLMLGPFKVSSLLSFLICIGALAVLVFIKRKSGKSEVVYNSVFAENFDNESENNDEDSDKNNQANLEENENDRTTESNDNANS